MKTLNEDITPSAARAVRFALQALIFSTIEVAAASQVDSFLLIVGLYVVALWNLVRLATAVLGSFYMAAEYLKDRQ